jgi:RimJ/RimL family protein N-acetyltransferase
VAEVIAAPPLLEGTLVRLRPVRGNDVELLTRWFDDPEVRYWLHHSDRPDASEGEVRDRFGPAAAKEGELRWMIEAGGGPVIGMVRLEGIDRIHGRAELAITIGEKAYWSRGYGTDAIRLALGHAFQDLGLRRVWLITDADNERGIRCYEKCGFKREGVLRAHRLRHRQPLDMLIMGAMGAEREARILREEWQK